MRLTNDQLGIICFPPDIGHLRAFSFQIPMGAIGAVFVKLLGVSYAAAAFRLLNVFFLISSTYFLGKITGMLYNDEKILIRYWLLAPFCFQFSFYSSWVYGNFPSISLIITAFYCLLKFMEEYKISRLIIILFLSAFAFALKLNAIVPILAVIIILGLKIIKNRTGVIKISSLITGLLLIIMFLQPLWIFLTNAALKYYTRIPPVKQYSMLVNISQGLVAYDAADKSAYEKLSEEKKLPKLDDLYGNWSEIINAHRLLYDNGIDMEYAGRRSAERIKYRLNEFLENPKTAARFFLRKQLINWCTSDFNALQAWGVYNNFQMEQEGAEKRLGKIFVSLQPGNKAYILFHTFADGYETLIYLSALTCLIFLWKGFGKNGEFKIELLIIPLTLTGQFILGLVTEGGPRFQFHIFPLLIPLAAAGLRSVEFKPVTRIFDRFRKTA
jgi:hypothetical protein